MEYGKFMKMISTKSTFQYKYDYSRFAQWPQLLFEMSIRNLLYIEEYCKEGLSEEILNVFQQQCDNIPAGFKLGFKLGFSFSFWFSFRF